MAVNTIRTPFYNQLYQVYITRPESLNSYLTSYQACNWAELLNNIGKSAAIHNQVKKILIEQNADQSQPAARYNIDALRNPHSVMVVTGQQLGLFASPLYTVYKAITTIKLAQQLNSTFPDTPFVPVFWLESEDHDFNEVNHIGIWDSQFNPLQLVYKGQDLGKTPLRYYNFSAEISILLDKIKNSLIPTEFSSSLWELITDLYRVDQNWVESTRLFLKYLLSSQGLLFFRPGAPAVKEISISFFENLLENSDRIHSVFSATSQDLQKQGYANQVAVIEGKTYIHFENEDRQRDHLYRDSNYYYLKNSTKKFSLKEVREFIRQFPQRVSSSVISRPLWQSWLLPTAVYVAGPAEIAYWAQLGNLFAGLGLSRPVVYPRITATIIEPKIARFIQKHQPDTENIVVRKTDFIHEYFQHHSADHEETPLQQISALFKEKESPIRDYLEKLDPTLVTVGEKVIERIQGQLDLLQDRVVYVREQKENLLVAHLNQIHQAIFPEQQPQERYISIIYFLNKFGPETMQKLYSGLQLDSVQHQLLYL